MWCGDGVFLGAENMPRFSTLFLVPGRSESMRRGGRFFIQDRLLQEWPLDWLTRDQDKLGHFEKPVVGPR